MTNFLQHNFLTDFVDGDQVVVLRKNKNRISGEPYTFNFDGNMPNEGAQIRAWYCEGTSEASADDRCDNMEIDMDMSGEHSGDHSEDSDHEKSEDDKWLHNDEFKFSYLSRSTPVTYAAARKFCKNQNGIMASPQNLIENNALAALIEEPIWLNVNLRPSLKGSYTFTNYKKYGTLLMKNGEWEIKPIEEKAKVMCVKPDGNIRKLKQY